MYARGSDSATKVITVPGDYATGSRFASVDVTVPATPTALTVTLSGLSVFLPQVFAFTRVVMIFQRL
ncbi:MAG: hypothetical protein EBX94_04600 [Burkholderiaceae bacterium]|nr:hypothetical protein [Burkholderiaceae bacterium]